MAAAPRWAGLLAAITIAAATANAAFMNTEVGRQALVDQWERTALALGQTVDDARYAELQELSANGALYGVVSAAINVPAVVFLVAVLIHVAFRRRQSGVPFVAVLAVVTHTAIVLAMRQIVAAPIAYARETTASATALGVWFPGFDEASPLARFLGLMDLFTIWWVLVLAVGVSVIYQRRTSRLAASFAGMYAGLAIALAVAMAVLGRSS